MFLVAICAMASLFDLAAAAAPLAIQDDVNFLAHWMGSIGPTIAGRSVLDLTLPGTHDTMTYDLGETVSDGGIDDYPKLAELLNDFKDLGAIGAFIDLQAQTQALNVTQQLDAGIRFLDFRIMYESGAKDWYCLHMMQSKQPSLTYLREVRSWIDAHPEEIVVIWLSKHGSQCAEGDDQYPGVAQDAKRAFWGQVEALFEGVLLDTATSSLATTTYSELLQRQHRVAFLASDFANFVANGTTTASDGCDVVDNRLAMTSVDSLDTKADLAVFAGHADLRKTDKALGKFYLLSMANSPPSEVIEAAAKIEFLPGGTSSIAGCAGAFHIPNFTAWCPRTLLDVGQLTAYYKQRVLDAAYDAGYAFPNAIYIDAVGAQGTIRTGPRLLTAASSDSAVCNVYKWSSCSTSAPDPSSCGAGWSPNGDKAHWDSYDWDGTKHGFCALAWQSHWKCCRDADGDHGAEAYAYADTLVAATVRSACAEAPVPECAATLAGVEARRQRYPLRAWDDALEGRQPETWPA